MILFGSTIKVLNNPKVKGVFIVGDSSNIMLLLILRIFLQSSKIFVISLFLHILDNFKIEIILYKENRAKIVKITTPNIHMKNKYLIKIIENELLTDIAKLFIEFKL